MYNEFEMSGLGSSGTYSRLNTPASAPAKNESNGLLPTLFFGTIIFLGAYAGYQYLKTGKLRLPWEPKEPDPQKGFTGRYGVLYDRNA